MKRERENLGKILCVNLVASAIILCVAGAHGAVQVESNLVYGSAVDYAGSNVVLRLDAYYEDSLQTNRPVVILAHGGGFGGGDKGYTVWQGSFYPDMAAAFAANGFVAFSINYRLWPGCSGGCTQAVDMAVADVLTAVDWIRAHRAAYGVDATRVLIAGDSAGGGLAINASYQSTHAASFFGCISLWGGVPPYGSDVHPVNTHPITAQTPPTCLIHGTDDMVVPYAISVDLFYDLTGASIYNELHPLEGYNHYPVMDDGVYNTNLVETIFNHMIAFAKLTASNTPVATPLRLGDYNRQVSDGQFIFDVSGPPNLSVEIEHSTNQLDTWQVIGTNQLLTGTAWFTNAVSASNGYYRARLIAP